MGTCLRGVLAGTIATGVMTGTILIGRWIGDKWWIPPEQITETIAGRLSGDDPEVECAAGRFWLAAHVLYGAAGGALYSLISQRVTSRGPREGLAFGLLVWLGSYCGFLPKLNIYPSPTRDRPARLVVMVVAHGVYGVVLGDIERRLVARHA